MNDMHETPDIEVAADDWEMEQKALADMAEEDARFAGINSCDALRIIDGVVEGPEEE